MATVSAKIFVHHKKTDDLRCENLCAHNGLSKYLDADWVMVSAPM